MSDAAHALDHDHDHDHDHDDHSHHPTGLMRWVKTTNHKDIGTMYLMFALIMLFSAGTMALLIRAELFQPGLQLTNPEFFNQLTTMHGLIMIWSARQTWLSRG
jgi:cytochrome c oxidase subunit 1